MSIDTVWVKGISHIPERQREVEIIYIEEFFLTEAECQAACDESDSGLAKSYSAQVAQWDARDAALSSLYLRATVEYHEDVLKNKILVDGGWTGQLFELIVPAFKLTPRMTYKEWLGDKSYSVPVALKRAGS